MHRYVVGLLFSPDFSKVVLIRKTKPKWQYGLLNGVGGKIEDGETPYQAMVREFREETDLEINDWTEIVRLSGVGFNLVFFAATSEHFESVKTTTEEEVVIVKVSNITRLPMLNNLRWIIPFVVFEHDMDLPLEINYPRSDVIDNYQPIILT